MALNDEISKIVGDDKEAVGEILGSLLGFDNWYWDENDYQQDRLVKASLIGHGDLRSEIAKMYDEAVADGAEIGGTSDKDDTVDALTAMVIGWEKWYPQWLEASEANDLSERRGLENEAYIYSDYGNPEEISQIYWDEDEPDVDLSEGGL